MLFRPQKKGLASDGRGGHEAVVEGVCGKVFSFVPALITPNGARTTIAYEQVADVARESSLDRRMAAKLPLGKASDPEALLGSAKVKFFTFFERFGVFSRIVG